ncbi:aldose epimerase family protein [Fusibacter bizertensis]
MRVEINKHEALSGLLHKRVDSITLTNNQGMSLKMLTYGCLMLALNVPDYSGISENVLMTYDDIESYVKNPLYLNSTIGINAGRLEKGQVTVDGKIYQTEINEGISNLHGGTGGLHKRIWQYAGETIGTNWCSVFLKYEHIHLSDGFPGNMTIEAEFRLNDDNQLLIKYTTIADRDCHLNLTNHYYFNLSGNERNKIDEHLLFINALYYKEIDKNGLPVEPKIQVKNSAFDFQQFTPIENAYRSDQRGVDHPFSLEDPIDHTKPNIVYRDPVSKRSLSIISNQPCAVVYTNNVVHKNHMGICFETQQFPNTLNLVEAGIEYVHETQYTFERD